MATANLSFTSAQVRAVLGTLGPTFTMIEFLSAYSDGFLSDMGMTLGQSTNVANAKAAAAALREAGCAKTGDQQAVDDAGHPTSTSCWSKR
jgi:hypothetical protein